MPQHALIVIGASAGGLEALFALIERLPGSLPAAVMVVMHTRADGTGVLPKILSRHTSLPVAFAHHGEAVQPGRIYVAPPDHHLLLTDHTINVLHGPRENGFRPAIDPMFRTAARAYGAKTIGVILSGALTDGTYGLNVIKQHGGTAIVQDPDDAIVPHLPRNALSLVDVDHVMPATDIASLVERLSLEHAEGEAAMPGTKDLEPQLPSEETEVAAMKERYGSPSALTCPDCGGALWEVAEGRVVRYQCHVGHQYSPESLDAEQRDVVESALWSAVRVLEEHAELKMRMAQRAGKNGLVVVSEGFEKGAWDAHRQAQQIRNLLIVNPATTSPGAADVEAAAVEAEVLAQQAAALQRNARAGRASTNGSKSGNGSKKIAAKRSGSGRATSRRAAPARKTTRGARRKA